MENEEPKRIGHAGSGFGYNFFKDDGPLDEEDPLHISFLRDLFWLNPLCKLYVADARQIYVAFAHPLSEGVLREFSDGGIR